MLAMAGTLRPPRHNLTDLFQSIDELPGGELDERRYEFTDDVHGHQQAFSLLGSDDGMAHQLFFDSLHTTYIGAVNEFNILMICKLTQGSFH